MNWPQGKRAATLDTLSNTTALVGGRSVPLARSLMASIPTGVRAVQLPLWLNRVMLQPHGTRDWFQGYPAPCSSRPLPPPSSLTHKRISTPELQWCADRSPSELLLEAILLPSSLRLPLILSIAWQQHFSLRQQSDHERDTEREENQKSPFESVIPILISQKQRP